MRQSPSISDGFEHLLFLKPSATFAWGSIIDAPILNIANKTSKIIKMLAILYIVKEIL